MRHSTGLEAGSSPTITSSRARIMLKLYGDGLEALQPCGRKQHPASRQKSRNLRRGGGWTVWARVRTRAGGASAAALVRSGLICYIERRRFGARPRGPRSFAVVAGLGDPLALGASGATRGGSSPLDRTTLGQLAKGAARGVLARHARAQSQTCTRVRTQR